MKGEVFICGNCKKVFEIDRELINHLEICRIQVEELKVKK